MMIMDFRQSKKVTVFGQRTAGAIDYLDFYPVDMPSKKYTIYIPGSKRVIPPGGKKYDGVGLDPDIPISDTVPDWIDFIKLFYGQGS
jgi:C-terminal processing protease CtpA/Prc